MKKKTFRKIGAVLLAFALLLSTTGMTLEADVTQASEADVTQASEADVTQVPEADVTQAPEDTSIETEEPPGNEAPSAATDDAQETGTDANGTQERAFSEIKDFAGSEMMPLANATVSTRDELQYALDNAAAGATITLGADITISPSEYSVFLDANNTAAGTITLELNGHTISAGITLSSSTDPGTFAIRDGKSLIIQDTVGGGGIRNTAANGIALEVRGSGTNVTINGGTYYGVEGAIYAAGADAVTLAAGTFSCNSTQYGPVTYVGGTNPYAIANGSFTTPMNWGKELDSFTVKVITPNDYTAYIGTTGYVYLQQAFDAAVAGDTVKLAKDITLLPRDAPVFLDDTSQNITLDLNGHTITGAKTSQSYNATLIVRDGREITITDSVGGGGITNTADAGYAVIIVGSGTMLDIQGGAYLGKSGAITLVSGPTVTLTAGAFTRTGASGAAVTGSGTYRLGANSIADPLTNWWLEASFTVRLMDAADMEAYIGTTGYSTLQAALNAAVSGDTVVLAKDITAAYGHNATTGGITIDLNGKTITNAAGSTPAYILWIEGSGVTLTDSSMKGGGRVENSASGNTFAIAASGTGTTLNITGGTYQSSYVGLYAQNGAAVTLTAGTFSGGFRAAAIYSSATDSITITTGSTASPAAWGSATTFTVTVTPPTVTINTQPAATTNVTQGSISASLRVEATVSNSTSPTFQWYESAANTNIGGEPIWGATSASYAIPSNLAVGTYYYYCVVSALGAQDVASNVATVNVSPALTYGVTHNVTGDSHTFPEATVGYGTQDALTVIVTNSGTGNAQNLAVALEGANASDYFTLDVAGMATSLTGTDFTTFKLTPKTGLAAKTYTATVSITGDNGISAGFTVHFTVNSKPMPDTADLAYSLAPVVYDGTAKPVAVQAANGISGMGDITVYYEGSATAPINAGTYAVTVNIAEGAGYAAVTGLELGEFIINKAEPTAADLEYSLVSVVYDGTAKPVTVSAASGISGLGDITVYYENSTIAPINAGTYAVTVDIAEGTNYSAAEGISLGEFTIDEDYTYSVTHNITTGSHTFPSAVVGYAGQEALTVKVANAGSGSAAGLDAALSGTGADGFTLDKTGMAATLTGTNSTTFTVTPKTGLAAATYTATVSITGDNGIAESFDVSFTVAAPVITIGTQPAAETSVMEGHISGSLVVSAATTGNQTLRYQWYSNATAANTGGTAIPDAADASFTIPTDLTEGTYYYYCVVSAEHTQDAVSSVAKVIVAEYSEPGLVVKNTNDSGAGSLREAVKYANANGGEITFAISESDPNYSGGIWTITLESALPAITKSVGINGRSAVEIKTNGGFRHFSSAGGDVTLTLTGLTLTGINDGTSGGGGVAITGDGTLKMKNCTVQDCFNGGAGGGVAMTGDSSTLEMESCTVQNCCVNRGGAGGDNGGGVYINGTATLTNCTVSGNTARDGGGIYNYDGSSPTLTNCTVSGNTARDGGGIYNYDGSNPALTDCAFTDNSATSGGGMYNNGSSPTLTDCAFADNSASSGGGMYNNSSSPMLTDCAFTDNSASSGGGVYNDVSSLTLADCIFTGNSASISGGGMYTYDSSPTLTNCVFTDNTGIHGGGMNNSRSSLVLANCTFTDNTGVHGGGMNNSSCSLALLNCTFTDNTATDDGGGMYNSVSSPALLNCTFTGNSATNSGGIYNSASSPVLTNCIVTLNNNSTTVTDNIYNLGSSSPSYKSSIIGNLKYESDGVTTSTLSPAPAAADFNADGSLTAAAVYAIRQGDYDLYAAAAAPIIAVLNSRYGTSLTILDMRDINGNLVVSGTQGSYTIDIGAFRCFEQVITGIKDYNVTYGDANFTISSSGFEDPVFSFTSNNSSVAAVDSNTGKVTIVGAGTATITVTAAATANYAETSVLCVVTVAKAEQILTGLQDLLKINHGDDFTVTPNSNAAAENPKISFQSSNVAVIDFDANGNFVIKGVGTATITVLADETINYKSTAATFEIKVLTDTVSTEELIKEAQKRIDDLEPENIGGGDGQYPQDAVDKLQDAIDEAQKIIDEPNASQEEADQAKEALQKAIEDFQNSLIAVDFTALDNAITEGKALAKGAYTDATWDALQAALTDGQALRGKANVTQTEADAAAKAINDAIAALSNAFKFMSGFGTFTGSGDLTGKIDAPYSKFVKLLIDGKEVASNNYTAADGSTVITLKESYLKTLKNGTYTVTVEFTDGFAETTLTVKESGSSTATGDSNTSWPWMALTGISILGIAGITVVRRKKLSGGKRKA